MNPPDAGPEEKDAPAEQTEGQEKADAEAKAEAERDDDEAKATSFAERIKAECTDMGNAKRLAKGQNGKIRYCWEHKRWLVWDGNRWEFDGGGEVELLAKATVRGMYDAAWQSQKEDIKLRNVQWSLQSQSAGRIDSMIKLARSEPGVGIEASLLDANSMLLGVSNGVIDLRTGVLRKAERGYYITKQAGVAYKRYAKCPKWDEFLLQICGGDTETVDFLQRLFGYCLTGLTKEQVFPIFWGKGANGKSVLLRTVQAAMGDYAMTTPAESVLQKRNSGGATPELARLHGARLAIASEPNDGCVLAETVVKQITGQDTIVCRRLYGDLFEYVPQFKVILTTNHLPRILGDDYGIWRRIMLVPFDVTIPKEKQNRDLIEELQAELPGILRWLVEGVVAYLDEGLNPPESVQQASQEYRSEMDIFGDWITDCCVEKQGSVTAVSELYSSYRGWCQQSGQHPLGRIRFGRKLEDRGFEKSRTGKVRSRVGLELKRAEAKSDLADAKKEADTTPDETTDQTPSGVPDFMTQKVNGRMGTG